MGIQLLLSFNKNLSGKMEILLENYKQRTPALIHHFFKLKIKKQHNYYNMHETKRLVLEIRKLYYVCLD